MRERLRGMELVARKGEGRKPVMKRKPGMAVMIAIGAPKKPPMGDEMDEKMGGEDEGMSKAEKIAALQEKIAALKAELALLEDEDEMDEVEEDAYEEDEARDEEMD
jgi:hypothetical protein